MEPIAQEIEAQRERRRLQNRESQRRWRERNKLQKAKAAHQSDHCRKRKRASTESSSHHRSSSYPSLGCKGCMARARTEDCATNVTAPDQESGTPIPPKHIFDESFSTEMKYPWASESLQQSSSTLAYHIPTHATDALSDIDNQLNHFQQQAVSSSETWPTLRGLQFHHSEQDIPTTMSLDENTLLPHSFSNLNSTALLNVPSLDYRDDCSSWTNSPGTPVSRSLIAPNTYPYDNHQTVLSHRSKRNSVNDNMRALMATTPNSGMVNRSATLMSHESDMSDMNPGTLLETMQKTYLKGITFGYWEDDMSVTAWLNRARNRYIDRP